MHRFKVIYETKNGIESYELRLVKKYNKHMKVRYYFVNLDTDCIIPQKFKTPAAALNFLDSLNVISWSDITSEESCDA